MPSRFVIKCIHPFAAPLLQMKIYRFTKTQRRPEPLPMHTIPSNRLSLRPNVSHQLMLPVCVSVFLFDLIDSLAPGMVQDLVDVVPVLDVPVEHAADEVDAFVADGERHPQISIHDLIDAVEWVLLVDDGV